MREKVVNFITGTVVGGSFIVFGMVLAGSFNLIPEAYTAAEKTTKVASVSSPSPVIGLPSFAPLVERVTPAVVTLEVVYFQKEHPSSELLPPGFEKFFDPRLFPFFQRPPGGEYRRMKGGSGFIISPDGYIVTNNHVIEGAEKIGVKVDDREVEATVVGVDPATDLALLKIEVEKELPYLKLGDSSELRVGDWVMVIGSPSFLEHTVTVGIVSAKGRQLGIVDFSLENFIQTDAAINFGNSGGPMINLKGEVVGIAVAKNFGQDNIGFAIPVNTLKTILDDLKTEGKVRRGYLGIYLKDLDYETKKAFGVENIDGVLVENVVQGSPADKAGIKHGDIVIAVDKIKVKNSRVLIDYIASRKPGEKVKVTFLRNGEKRTVEVKLGERNGSRSVSDQGLGKEGEIGWLGIEYDDVNSDLLARCGLPSDVENGVIVTGISTRSPLYDKNVRKCSLILEVNGKEIRNAEEFETIISKVKKGDYVRFYVMNVLSKDNYQKFFVIVKKPSTDNGK